MKQIMTYAVPMDIANVDNEEMFKEQARTLGYVWKPGELSKSLTNKNFKLYGLVMKTILE